MELIGDFKTLLSSIEPKPAYVAAAKTGHEKVREQLRLDEESKQAHKDTFLSGSYTRSTAIKEIKDVDVICLLDINHIITPPEVVLAWIDGILSRYYSVRKHQGRSVGVQATQNVWLDIVPSTPISADSGPIYIPDREAHEWVPTHPRGQIAAAVNQNKATNGYYVQVVKLIKFWRDRLPRESCRPKSYIVETLVYRTIGYPASHARAVVNVLEGIERTYSAFRETNTVPSIQDPGYSSVNVAKRWTSSEFDEFMTEVQIAAPIARQALDATDDATSRRLWRRLFGNDLGQ